jgi:hypothetical protein
LDLQGTGFGAVRLEKIDSKQIEMLKTTGGKIMLEA